jgi:ribonuclease BN (tRNA processing enzyme)
MDPRIIFLGTAGDITVSGKQLRASGGIVVAYNDIQFHIDPGPGTLCKAAEFGIHVRNTTAIIVTSNDINQCNDVNALIEAMTYCGLDRKGVLVGTESLFNCTEKSEPYLTKFHRSLPEKLIVVKPDYRVGIEDTDIRFLGTKQKDEHAVGIKFYTPKFKMVYSSVTAYDSSLINQYKDTEILILNVRNPQGKKNNYTLNSEDALKIVQAVKPKLTLLTGFGIDMLRADPLMEARYIQKNSGCQIIAAKDGMVINPVSYDASLKQKTLNIYR